MALQVRDPEAKCATVVGVETPVTEVVEQEAPSTQVPPEATYPDAQEAQFGLAYPVAQVQDPLGFNEPLLQL